MQTCISCGSTLPPGVDSCPQCGSPVPAMPDFERQASQVSKLAIAALLLLSLVALGLVVAQVRMPVSAFLPVQSRVILASYNPRPPMVRVQTTGHGTTVRYFRDENLDHTLELEERSGQLLRATLKFDRKSLLDRSGNSDIDVPGLAGNFLSAVGRTPAERLSVIIGNLNLTHPWMRGTSQVILNGVRITRSSDGDALSLDVVAASR
jgi:hypothetical protein